MTEIARVVGREVLDSRGRPTVEAEVWTADGNVGRAIVPSGASTGSHEAHELRDGDPKRFDGRGVLTAVAHVNGEIARAVTGRDIADQAGLDAALAALDGTPTKQRLGANALLAVSLATVRAAAECAHVPLFQYLSGGESVTLPVPMVNVISGGMHARQVLDFQDYLVLPVGAPNYREALRWAVQIRTCTGQILESRGVSTLMADEGGFGPALKSNDEAIDIMLQAIELAGLEPGRDVFLGLDIASQHFFDGEAYVLASEHRRLDRGAMVDWLSALIDRYPIISVEDGLAEDDWDGWIAHTGRSGHRAQIIGDDLFTTNLARLEQGIRLHAANAILIKVNQVGTLTEAKQAVVRAREAGFRTVVSARSGETEDTTIADLAVGLAAGQIKIGSVATSERLAKYNQLLRIESALGDGAIFAGASVFAPFLG